MTIHASIMLDTPQAMMGMAPSITTDPQAMMDLEYVLTMMGPESRATMMGLPHRAITNLDLIVTMMDHTTMMGPRHMMNLGYIITIYHYDDGPHYHYDGSSSYEDESSGTSYDHGDSDGSERGHLSGHRMDRGGKSYV